MYAICFNYKTTYYYQKNAPRGRFFVPHTPKNYNKKHTNKR